MAVDDIHVIPSFLTPALTPLFFPKPLTTFLTCFCTGERQKYAGKKVRLNRGSNSKPPGHESLTTEPPGPELGEYIIYKYNCKGSFKSWFKYVGHKKHDNAECLRLGQTSKRICYGGKTDKTCRIWNLVIR